ncbi:hypothetical protein [Blautia sp. 210702-DFI.1.159]|uniref:hypothetical protein n=1 Tax=Blautia sp. 210702-DFI.1.159 TaxID=2883262 RepID=UPI001D097E14|nr:hypothetical protein [Blautia sp. 210702-DFI.1.159]MCB6625882.1 hypothetical protein [Blautia sp. 210702-DFI.1.159]
MADQVINALSTKTAPETSDQLLILGTGEPQLIDYDKLADAILNKITSKNYALDAGQMTLLAALNKLNSETKKYISRAEYIKTENNRTLYRIAPIVSDISVLCINRTGLYLITLGQTGGVFNNASVKKIYEGGNDAKIQIGENRKSIIFECDIYSNPIFISVFK